MYPLLACSIISWVVIFERLWNYKRLGQNLSAFHLEALNALMRRDRKGLVGLCQRRATLPTARLVTTALERLEASDPRLKAKWREALDRKRQLINQELRQNLWMLGTIGSAAPFIGLFGTVVGILRSFQEMARTGSGGFNVVAAGISESLIATAAGIIVAVIAVLAFNSFQTLWSGLVLKIRIHTEELAEMLASESEEVKGGD